MSIEISRIPFSAQDNRLLDASPDAMLVINVRGEMVLVNRQTETLFGYRREELLGEAVEKLIPERFHTHHLQHRQQYATDPNVRPMGDSLELVGRHRDGSEFPVEISLSPYESQDDAFVVCAIRDVTQHVETERILVRAIDTAEKATANKSRFLAAASHDIRQPLQSMGLYLSLLRRKGNPDRQSALLDQMQLSLDMVSDILNSLLDISKLEQGAIEPVKEDVSLKTLLDAVVVDNFQQAKSKGLKLIYDIQGFEDTIVESDPALLIRIVENFVGNAIRYTETGEVRIHCGQKDGAVEIKVTDTGIGITEQDAEQIFEEYYRADESEGAGGATNGLGLGLSIARHIADLLGHPLNLNTAPGVGSTFSVLVPSSQTLSAPDLIKNKIGMTISQAHPSTVVLFVDDDQNIVDSASILLESIGMEVYAALNGPDALKIAEAGLEPDVLISDFRLPGCNGIDLIKQLREHSERTLPAVVMTGDTSSKTIEAASLSDCTILHKPVDPEILVALIERLTLNQATLN